MPLAVAIPAAIGLGTSIASGVMGSRAAHKAADIQYRANQEAGQQFRQAGDTAMTGVRDASGRAIDVYGEASNDVQDRLANMYNSVVGRIDPYSRLGEQGASMLSDYMQPGGRLDKEFAFNPTDLQNDPGYQFRLAEGMKALQGSAAARGVLGTSGTLKGITAYGQNLASTEYQNAYDRALKTYTTNQENTRANLAQLIQPGLKATDQFSNVAQNYATQSGNVRLGQGAYTANTYQDTARWLGNTGLGIQKTVNDYLLGGANAQAAGVVGGANAWSSALQNIGDIGMWAGGQLNQPRSQGGTPIDTSGLPSRQIPPLLPPMPTTWQTSGDDTGYSAAYKAYSPYRPYA